MIVRVIARVRVIVRVKVILYTLGLLSQSGDNAIL